MCCAALERLNSECKKVVDTNGHGDIKRDREHNRELIESDHDHKYPVGERYGR